MCRDLLVGDPLFAKARAARGGVGVGLAPLLPSAQLASASSRARLSRTAAGHQLHAPRHVGACTTTCGRGKGARGPKRLSPWLAHQPHPIPRPLTRPRCLSPVLALMFSRKKWPLERC